MTKLLTEVMRKIVELPEQRQDDAAHVLLAMLENDPQRHPFTNEDLHEIDLAIAEADAGRFATDDEVDAALHRPWQ